MTIAQRLKTGRRLAQRRDDGRRRRVLRGRHPLAAPRRQPRPEHHADRTASGRRRRATGPDRRAKSMMVAFRYDNGAVGSLYYSREIPSLFQRAARCRSCSAATGVITFESNGVVRRSCAARACRGCCSRASATSAATRRCIAISSRAIRDGRAPEMSLERAIDDQRLMDQIYASVGNVRAVNRTLRHHHHRQRRRRRHDGARAVADTAARILILERGDFVPQEARTGIPTRSGRSCATAPTERWLDERGQRVPPVHALQRRRQHQVLGQRALPAAPRGLRGGAARGRRLAGVADRLRDARAVLRAGRAPVPGARRRRATIRPSRRAGRIRTRRCRTQPGWRRSSRSCARRGCIRRRCRSGCCVRRSGRLHPVQHLQLVRLQAPREERRRGLLRPPGAAAAERHAVDERPRRPPADRSVRPHASRRVEVERDGETVRVDGAAGRSSRAAPSTRRRCCCDRRTTSIRTAWRTPPGWSAGATWRTSRR